MNVDDNNQEIARLQFSHPVSSGFWRLKENENEAFQINRIDPVVL